jgi:nicotinamide-nucleotide amidase
MKISVINTGNELLSGTTINTNLSFIGRMLTASGMKVARAVTVPDNAVTIRQALSDMLLDSDVVMMSGGLGSTSDDITREVVCATLNLPLQINYDYHKKLQVHWETLNRGTVPCELFNQAKIPDKAVILENHNGTAPGLWIDAELNSSGKHIILLPGPPAELEPMFLNEVMPRLLHILKEKIYTEHFMVIGTSELFVQQQIEKIIAGTGISPAYCASTEGVKTFLSSSDLTLLQEKTLIAIAAFGSAVATNRKLSLVDEVFEMLKSQNFTLATAESCTGGMIAAAFTDLPGSSLIFSGSIVAYSNQVKIEQLDVPENIIVSHGAVSEECVTAMVANVRKKFHTNAGIAVSGIAGPGGGTEQKPVGLVYIGAELNERRLVKKFQFKGSRAEVRHRAVVNALRLLRELLLTADVE